MNASVVNASMPSPTESETALQGSCCRNWKSSFPVCSSHMRTVWSAEAVNRRDESTAHGGILQHMRRRHDRSNSLLMSQVHTAPL